jgi:copper chaperone CopZ
MAETTVTVSGIHCAGCEDRIQAVLGRIEGVRKVKADHQAQTVTVGYDPRRLDGQRVAEELERIGFPQPEPA